MPLCVVRDRRTAKGSECSRRTEAATTLRRSYSTVFYLPQLPSRDYQKLLPGMTLRSRPSQFYRAFYRAWFSAGGVTLSDWLLCLLQLDALPYLPSPPNGDSCLASRSTPSLGPQLAGPTAARLTCPPHTFVDAASHECQHRGADPGRSEAVALRPRQMAKFVHDLLLISPWRPSMKPVSVVRLIGYKLTNFMTRSATTPPSMKHRRAPARGYVPHPTGLPRIHRKPPAVRTTLSIYRKRSNGELHF